MNHSGLGWTDLLWGHHLIILLSLYRTKLIKLPNFRFNDLDVENCIQDAFVLHFEAFPLLVSLDFRKWYSNLKKKVSLSPIYINSKCSKKLKLKRKNIFWVMKEYQSQKKKLKVQYILLFRFSFTFIYMRSCNRPKSDLNLYINGSMAKYLIYSKNRHRAKISKDATDPSLSYTKLNRLEDYLLKPVIPFLRIGHLPRGRYFLFLYELLLNLFHLHFHSTWPSFKITKHPPRLNEYRSRSFWGYLYHRFTERQICRVTDSNK